MGKFLHRGGTIVEAASHQSPHRLSSSFVEEALRGGAFKRYLIAMQDEGTQ